jgi:hypothetical protein
MNRRSTGPAARLLNPLDDSELAALQQLAHRRGVSASVIVRELVRAQWAKLRASGHLGSGPKGRR